MKPKYNLEQFYMAIFQSGEDWMYGCLMYQGLSGLQME